MGFLDGLLGGSSTQVDWDKMPDKSEKFVNEHANAMRGLIADAGALYQSQKGKPYGRYPGQEVAGLDEAERWGIGLAGATDDWTRDMQGLMRWFADQDYTLSNNQQMIDALYNPYQQQVIDATLADMDRRAALDQMDLDAAMVAGGAFGGSQHGVAKGIAMDEALRSRANVGATLRKEGFDTAAGLAQQDLDRMMENYRASIDALGTGAAAGTDVATTEAALGAQRRGIQQARLDRAKANWMEERDWPWTQLDRYAGILAGGGNPAQNAAAAPVTTSTNPGVLTTAAGLGMTGLALFCDARIKTDERRVGSLRNGAGIYEFRYLWDEPGTVRLGPIAQEVAEVQPDAVITDPDSGYMAVLVDRLEW